MGFRNTSRTVILDLDKFIARERHYWGELTALLKMQDDQPDRRMPLDEAVRRVMTGEIKDAKTAIAILKLKERINP